MSVVRRLVYVSGAPGSGKSTLAAPLAAELGYTLLGKDVIKETLHGVLGPPDLDRARSRELGAASMELLWALAALSPHVVIEANFRPYSDYERDRITGLGGVQVEVHCACPPELAVARYNARARHPVHVQTNITPDYLTEFDRPVGIGALVTVDTSAPVDVASLAAQVRAPRIDGVITHFLLLYRSSGAQQKILEEKNVIRAHIFRQENTFQDLLRCPGGVCLP